MSKTIVITGGSRGIGLEFTRQYLKKGHQVFAASRDPLKSPSLQKLKGKYKDRLVIYPLDVADQRSRRDFYRTLSERTQSVDILINNAGILSGNEDYCHPFGALDQEGLSKIFHVNAIAPLMMAECLFPLLHKGKNPTVANISSENGSISKRNQRGKYGYCASKAALNMITRILSHELKDHGIKVLALHPGWVKTSMTKHEDAPLEPAISIEGMIQVIETLEIADTGSFLDWKGEQIPW